MCLDVAVIVAGEGPDGTPSGFTALIKNTTIAISHHAGVDLLKVTTACTSAAVLGNVLLDAVLGLATVRGSDDGGQGDREEECLNVHVGCA